MVSGVDIGLVIRATGALPGIGFERAQNDDPAPRNARNSSPQASAGALASGTVQAFGADEEGSEEGGPFFVSGLNGLLAPPSIASVQEENGQNGGRTADSGAEIRQPSASPSAALASSAAQSADEEGPDGLTPEEEELVRDLQQRDAEVRRHEQAHKAVGGQYAGAISYTYQSGPDGKRYAIGGEVPIDASPIPGDPEATIRKLEQVRRAALAPAEPSGADRAVAAQASQGIQQARAEQAQQNAEELEELLQGGDEGSAAQQNDQAGDTERNVGSTNPESGAFEPLDRQSEEGTRTNSSAFDVGPGESGRLDLGESLDRRSEDRAADFFDSDVGGQSPFDLRPNGGQRTLNITI